MSTAYAVAYRLGITPWESAGAEGQEQLARLLSAIESQTAQPRRALDVGCGRGHHAVTLAQRGWSVTGVDQIGRALQSARQRAAAAGVRVDFVEGDATALPGSIGTGFTLVLDVGCFHGLSDGQRQDYGRGITMATAPGASLLMLAFRAGGRGPLPRGADGEQILAALPGWSITHQEPAETAGMPRRLRARAPQFYSLTRI